MHRELFNSTREPAVFEDYSWERIKRPHPLAILHQRDQYVCLIFHLACLVFQNYTNKHYLILKQSHKILNNWRMYTIYTSECINGSALTL